MTDACSNGTCCCWDDEFVTCLACGTEISANVRTKDACRDCVEAVRAERNDYARVLRECRAHKRAAEQRRLAKRLAAAEPLFVEPGSVVEAEWLADEAEACGVERGK